MSVHYQPNNSIQRKPFTGDPAELCPHTDGRNPRHLNPNYESNKAKRAQQAAPANKSRPAHKGPSHRAPGTSQEDWRKLMGGR